MANVQKIIGKLMTFLPKAEGAAAKMRLTGGQLKMMTKNKRDGELLQKLLSGTKNPTLDIAYKAKSNYTIASLRLYDGKRVLGRGAVSVVNPGKSDAVFKYKISAGENGKLLSSNGFVDGGKPVNADDIAMGFQRKGGNIRAHVAVDQVSATHLTVNEPGVIDFAKQVGADKFLQNYTKNDRIIQQKLSALMCDIRKTFRGEGSSVIVDKAEKAAEEAKINKIKLVDSMILRR